eukprot:scaffold752_cov322-Pavlova_lutheri.AAC.30
MPTDPVRSPECSLPVNSFAYFPGSATIEGVSSRSKVASVDLDHQRSSANNGSSIQSSYVIPQGKATSRCAMSGCRHEGEEDEGRIRCS